MSDRPRESAAGAQDRETAASGEAGRRKLPVLPAGGPTHGVGGTLPMDRRQALKVMAIAAAGPSLASCAPADDGSEAAVPSPTSNRRATGTAWDPDLVAPVVPWERTLTADELQSLAALCDVIIPADERSPSASQVGAHDFLDEWVSAPYDRNREDAVLVRGGLIWLDRETASRFGDGLRFRDLTEQQKLEICDDICYEADAPAGYEGGARFFDRVRDLTANAFWTSAEGMEDLQYVGNVPLAQWDPPPPEVLRHVGVEG
jgi:gluconate 2-dehydrogenase gamma chain